MSTKWYQQLSDRVLAMAGGAFVVDLSAYRPDLAEEIAQALELRFLDFRARYLAPLGFEAHRLPLSAIEAAIVENAGKGGLMLHNAEALLATKPVDERKAWFQDFLATPRAGTVVLPLALYGHEIADHPRLVRFAPGELPAESMLMQLGSMRFA